MIVRRQLAGANDDIIFTPISNTGDPNGRSGEHELNKIEVDSSRGSGKTTRASGGEDVILEETLIIFQWDTYSTYKGQVKKWQWMGERGNKKNETKEEGT